MPGGKYKHGAADDEYTDAFIESTLNTAPRNNSVGGREMNNKDSKARLMSDSERREWAADIYSDQKPTKKSGCSCGSCTVMFFSFLLCLIGIGVIVIARIEKQQKLLPLCPKCDTIITSMYIAGGAIMFVALIGMGAAKTRSKVLAVPFTSLMIIIGIAFVAVGVAGVIYKTGIKSFNLEPLWHEEVVRDPEFICDLQENMQCSGFTQCCYTNANHSHHLADANAPYIEFLVEHGNGTNGGGGNNTSGYCYITGANGTIPEEAERQCVLTCESNKYAKPCDDALREKLSEHMIPFVATVFPVAFFMFIISVVSIKMTNRKEE